MEDKVDKILEIVEDVNKKLEDILITLKKKEEIDESDLGGLYKILKELRKDI